jgi:hypothetical protein
MKMKEDGEERNLDEGDSIWRGFDLERKEEEGTLIFRLSLSISFYFLKTRFFSL